MKQQYYLKKSGVSFFEQAYMTAEERSWWFDQIEKENEDIQRKSGGGSRNLT
ncbi:MAG: hypothetical protein JRI22_20180 [Deltaproteobacteria bacterium]|nr:hypothetical protein [Deltaproteobacteria bacterium]